MTHVEAQLHGGRELVDILPAGAGGADEAFRELVLVNRDMVGDADHHGARVIWGLPGLPGNFNATEVSSPSPAWEGRGGVFSTARRSSNDPARPLQHPTRAALPRGHPLPQAEGFAFTPDSASSR